MKKSDKYLVKFYFNQDIEKLIEIENLFDCHESSDAILHYVRVKSQQTDRPIPTFARRVMSYKRNKRYKRNNNH